MAFVYEFIGYIAVFLELSHQHFTALVNRQFLILVFKELTNLVARLAGLDHVEPVTTRTKGVGVGDNFNLIPCLELGCQWNHTAIDLGTSRFFTDFGMDFIGKVNRSSAKRFISNRGKKTFSQPASKRSSPTINTG